MSSYASQRLFNADNYCERECYNLRGKDETAYRYAMGKLSNTILVWPPVHGHTNAKKEVKEAYMLDAIAKELKHQDPTSFLLTDQKPSHTQLLARMWVLTRDQSNSTDGIKLPHDLHKFKKTARHELVQSGLQWPVQQNLPLLSDIGQWRCFLIGELVNHVVFTYPGNTGKKMTIVPVEHFKNIQDLS